MIGLHLWNNLPLGTVGVRTGALMAASELFQCTIHGKGGPWGNSPPDHRLVGGWRTDRQRPTGPSSPATLTPPKSAVVTVGRFHAGTAQNVIADTAHFGGTVRYFDPAYADLFPERIEQIIAGICQSHGATYSLDYNALYPPVINDPDITELVRSVALSVTETPAGVVPDCHTMGGEDMSFFLQEVPGCYFFFRGGKS